MMVKYAQNEQLKSNLSCLSYHFIIREVMSSNPVQARCTRYNICNKVCQGPAKGRWFSPGTPVSSNNKTDHHEIVEILLKVASNTITPL
jgi:hypothetical protein